MIRAGALKEMLFPLFPSHFAVKLLYPFSPYFSPLQTRRFELSDEPERPFRVARAPKLPVGLGE